MIPITAFISNIFIMIGAGTCSDIKSGIISSEVERYIAISVPSVMTLPAYRFEAAAENPH